MKRNQRELDRLKNLGLDVQVLKQTGKLGTRIYTRAIGDILFKRVFFTLFFVLFFPILLFLSLLFQMHILNQYYIFNHM